MPLLEVSASYLKGAVSTKSGEAIASVRHFLKNLDRFIRGEPLVDRVT